MKLCRYGYFVSSIISVEYCDETTFCTQKRAQYNETFYIIQMNISYFSQYVYICKRISLAIHTLEI